MRGCLGLLVVVGAVAAAPGPATAGEAAHATNRPQLVLRVTPSAAFSPATVQVVAQLVGGADAEDFYCPALEWDFGDGSRSRREGDCPPFDEDTKMARLFSRLYRYHEAGEFRVSLTLRRAGRTVVSASVPIRLLGRGEGDTLAGDPAASVH